MLGPLDATQHLIGPIDVRLEGGRATAECHLRGYHVWSSAAGTAEWTLAGQWMIELGERDGAWHATALTLRTFYQTGNRDLLREAAGLPSSGAS